MFPFLFGATQKNFHTVNNKEKVESRLSPKMARTTKKGNSSFLKACGRKMFLNTSRDLNSVRLITEPTHDKSSRTGVVVSKHLMPDSCGKQTRKGFSTRISFTSFETKNNSLFILVESVQIFLFHFSFRHCFYVFRISLRELGKADVNYAKQNKRKNNIDRSVVHLFHFN